MLRKLTPDVILSFITVHLLCFRIICDLSYRDTAASFVMSKHDAVFVNEVRLTNFRLRYDHFHYLFSVFNGLSNNTSDFNTFLAP